MTVPTAHRSKLSWNSAAHNNSVGRPTAQYTCSATTILYISATLYPFLHTSDSICASSMTDGTNCSCRLAGLLEQRLSQVKELPTIVEQLLEHDQHLHIRNHCAATVLLHFELMSKETKPADWCLHKPIEVATGKLYPASAVSACSSHLIWDHKAHQRHPCTSHQFAAHVAHTKLTFAGVCVLLPDDAPPEAIAVKALLQLLPLMYPPASKNAPRHNASMREQVCYDFCSPLQGNVVHELQDYTLATNAYIGQETSVVYAKSFPVLQSSGTSKSKMVVQLSAFQAGILVCACSPTSQPGKTSFPPIDAQVYNFLCEAKPSIWSFSAHCRIACWLGAYFDQLRICLEYCMAHSGCFDKDSQPLHPNRVAACRSSVVYDLAVAIHDGSNFIKNYTFFDPQGCTEALNSMQGCPTSTLTSIHHKMSRNPGLAPVSSLAPDKEHSVLKWAYSQFQMRSTVMGSYARCRLTAVATPLRGNSARPFVYTASTPMGVSLPCVQSFVNAVTDGVGAVKALVEVPVPRLRFHLHRTPSVVSVGVLMSV